MSSIPTVTVLVASYNYARYLGVALRSILAQSWQDFEVLVVDDGSTDESLAIARSFAAEDPRVRVFTHADGENHGLAATLSLGLKHAKGRWTAFLESDDLWLPDNLSRRIQTAESSGAGVILNDISLLPMPGANTAWFEGYVPRVMSWHQRKGYCSRAYSAASAFFMENKIPTFSCGMILTGLLRDISLASPVAKWLDWWVWAQLATRTTFAFVPEKLTQWRLHDKSYHARVSFWQYLKDYGIMGNGLRSLITNTRGQKGQWAALAFLWLPPSLRLASRLALPFLSDGLSPTVNGVCSRLGLPARSDRKL